MRSWAYYNELDPYCCAWIRNLIKAGLISDGEVDARSIVDVRPSDLRGFDRCHWFSGIAVWDYALIRAAWPAERPIWTGSCPCQPFSTAGPGAGLADERHLWPAWFDLIRECQPATILGEQVASQAGLDWLDLVYADLEGAGYAVGAVDLGAAGVGAPHIRQRLWFVGDTRREGSRRHSGAVSGAQDASAGERGRARDQPDQPVAAGANGFWSDADWILCRDGKRRPVKSGLKPLVAKSAFELGSGSSFEGRSRAAMLRGYGNAICAEAAVAFIGACLDVCP